MREVGRLGTLCEHPLAGQANGVQTLLGVQSNAYIKRKKPVITGSTFRKVCVSVCEAASAARREILFYYKVIRAVT